MRTHDKMIEEARQVQFAPTEAAHIALSKQYGINGLSILSSLPGISFPSSFPYDFMHLVFENVMKTLVLLWTGKFKALDTGTGDYQLLATVWDAIGAATAALGSTLPSAFCSHPPNIADDRKATTADSWSFWMQYIGPLLL